MPFYSDEMTIWSQPTNEDFSCLMPENRVLNKGQREKTEIMRTFFALIFFDDALTISSVICFIPLKVLNVDFNSVFTVGYW